MRRKYGLEFAEGFGRIKNVVLVHIIKLVQGSEILLISLICLHFVKFQQIFIKSKYYAMHAQSVYHLSEPNLHQIRNECS